MRFVRHIGYGKSPFILFAHWHLYIFQVLLVVRDANGCEPQNGSSLGATVSWFSNLGLCMTCFQHSLAAFSNYQERWTPVNDAFVMSQNTFLLINAIQVKAVVFAFTWRFNHNYALLHRLPRIQENVQRFFFESQDVARINTSLSKIQVCVSVLQSFFIGTRLTHKLCFFQGCHGGFRAYYKTCFKSHLAKLVASTRTFTWNIFFCEIRGFR